MDDRSTMGHLSGRSWVSGVVGALVLCSGCELGNSVQGLAEELGNPEPQYVETPGHLIVKGQYESIQFDGNSNDGPYVTALQDGETLAVIRFPDGETCDAGPAVDYWRSVARDGDALDARIPILRPATEDAPAELRFVDFACKADKLRVPHAEQPLGKFVEEQGFLVQTDEKQILLVDPWRGKQRVIAREAAAVERGVRGIFENGTDGERYMWTIEAGEVVARDRKLREVFRAGHDIEKLDYVRAGSESRLLLRDSSDRLLVVHVDRPSELQTIATDACEPRVSEGQAGLELFYYAPCESRELHVLELETGVTRDIRAGIDNYKVVGESDTGPALLYVTHSASDENDTTLWARWGQNDPIRLGDKGNLGLSRVTSKQEARIVIDWDGKGGTLLVGQLGEKLEARAEGVAYHSSAGIISNFDGENGTLRRFDDEHALETIAKGVAAKGVRNDGVRDRTLVLMDYDGEAKEGRLVVIEGESRRTLADHVRPDYYRFSDLTERVMVLSDYDEESKSSTLQLPSTEYDEQAVVASGVGEFIEVDWPRSGILYAVIDGKKPGIYFSKYY